MTLYDLIGQVSWSKVRHAMEKNFFRQEDERKREMSVAGFRKVLGCLLSLEPKESRTVLSFSTSISITNDGGSGLAEIHILGIGGKPDEDPVFGLAMTPWREWLGMQVDDIVIQCFSAEDVVSFCLYEMTYFGNDMEQVDATIAKLKRENRKRSISKHNGSYDIMWRRLERNSGNTEE